MRKLCAVLMCLMLLVAMIPMSAVSVSAGKTASEIKEQINTIHKLSKASFGKGFSGYCGAYVGWQLYHLGINTSYVGKDGKDTYEYYQNKKTSSGGYKITAYPANQYKNLKNILNTITANGTKDAYNIVVCLQKGNTAASYQYGHVAVIHAIIDGICYYSESGNLQLSDGYFPSGSVLTKSIDACARLFAYVNGGYTPELEGVIHFTKNENVPTTTYANIAEGQYFLRNKADGKYLAVSGAKDADGTALLNYDYTGGNAQVYDIKKTADGYEMRPLCSTSRVVNVYANLTDITSGKEVNLVQRGNNKTQWWKFEAVGDGFVIRNAQSHSVCITPNGSKTMISTYTGADNQIWYLEKACSVTFDANGGSGAPGAARVRSGYSVTVTKTIPTRQCHTFLGWSTSQNDSTPEWKPGDAAVFTNNTTLYAVWAGDKHLYANGADNTCDICGAIRTSGDMNNDGKVNNKDLGLLQQYLNGWTVTVSEKGADTNGDGKVNNKDLGLLQQYLNGWNVELG